MLLYLLLSTVYSGEYRGRPNTDYLTSSLIAYGVANTAFGGLAIILVVRRELGILKRIRATPLPAPMYLAAALCSILFVFVLQASSSPRFNWAGTVEYACEPYEALRLAGVFSVRDGTAHPLAPERWRPLGRAAQDLVSLGFSPDP